MGLAWEEAEGFSRNIHSGIGSWARFTTKMSTQRGVCAQAARNGKADATPTAGYSGYNQYEQNRGEGKLRRAGSTTAR